MRSESCTFIWQPKVSIRYFRATNLPSCPLCPLCPWCCVGLRFRPFAFAPRPRRAFRAARALHQHLTRGASETIAYGLAAEHARQLVNSLRVVETPNRCRRAPFLDSLLDVNMRIGVGGNLREMRDAQHLERRPQRAQLAADHVRHAPANPGIDLVEYQSGGPCPPDALRGDPFAPLRIRPGAAETYVKRQRLD